MFQNSIYNPNENTEDQTGGILRENDSPSKKLTINTPRKSRNKKFIHDCDTKVCSQTTKKSMMVNLKVNKFTRYYRGRAMLEGTDSSSCEKMVLNCFGEDEWDISDYADSEILNKASIGMSIGKSETNSDISSFFEEDVVKAKPRIEAHDITSFHSGFLTKSSSCSMVSESLKENEINEERESSEDTIELLMKYSKCYGIDFRELRVKALGDEGRRSLETGDSLKRVNNCFEGKLQKSIKNIRQTLKGVSSSCRNIEVETVFKMELCGHYAKEKQLYQVNEGFLDAPGRMVKFCPNCA